MDAPPRRRLPRLTALACTAFLAGMSVAVLSTTPARAEPAPAVHRPSQVTLPTGQQVSLRWFGATPHVGRLAGDRTPMSVLTVGTHVYAIPRESLPHLDRELDRSLFDVTALAAHGGRDEHVSLTYSGSPVDVPGVRITSVDGVHAQGVLDPHAALAPVAGVSRIALDAPGAGVVHPHFPQVTLTIKLTPPSGRTIAGAAVLVANTDDTRKFYDYVAVGPENYARVSVPKGTYTLAGSIAVAGVGDAYGPSLVPIVTDYAVTNDGQSVTLDANKATARPTFSTPRPSELVSSNVDVVPTDGVRSPDGGLGFLYDSEDNLFVQPTPKPKHGVLEFDAYEHRSAAPAEYRLTAERLSGIPANLHRTVRAGELARIDDVVHNGGTPRTHSILRGPIYPDLRGALDTGSDTTSTRSTEYLYGPPSVRWDSGAYHGNESMFSSNPVSYRPGRTYRVDWFRPSLAPGFPATSNYPRPHCVACRSGDGLQLNPADELDADPGHYGNAGGDATGFQRLQLFRDGTRILDATDTPGATLRVDAAARTYRLVDTVDRAKLGFTTSTRTTSDWTFRSSATSGSPITANTDCYPLGNDGCTVLPVLTANVPLPVGETGTLPTGTSSFVASIGHVQDARKSAIRTFSFATSLDGAAFRPAKVVALGSGRFRVTLTGSTAGRVSIRLRAADVAGSTLTQTVTDAYTVRSAS